VRVGSDAIAAMLEELPMLGWVGRVIRFPLVRPFARVAYRQIANNRRACAKKFAMTRLKGGADVRRPDREPLF
jgi:predicted DCC family thiol-disulfide oxidoreductase YuxK